MKCRFHVLHTEVRLSPERGSKFISVCGIRRNICQQRNIPQPEDDSDDDDVFHLDEVEQSGQAYRDHFVNTQ